jgi:hypothetical protein
MSPGIRSWSTDMKSLDTLYSDIPGVSDSECELVLDILLKPRFMHQLGETEASRSGMVCPAAVSTHFSRLMMVQKCVLWGSLAMERYITMPFVWQFGSIDGIELCSVRFNYGIHEVYSTHDLPRCSSLFFVFCFFYIFSLLFLSFCAPQIVCWVM